MGVYTVGGGVGDIHFNRYTNNFKQRSIAPVSAPPPPPAAHSDDTESVVVEAIASNPVSACEAHDPAMPFADKVATMCPGLTVTAGDSDPPLHY
ncbi:hypothetical protein CYMTET_10539 [Cymbomonas tetramitiformis]|uniref:Uncharacterized protein n=1 Tax=Cymbomonas tetramitiformis TaxID=36881 RepID=A0AAE0GPE0_9CHLO|nr:hypothetical protein CYMTET_10539 [Cymbomonas tetramitiformis]